MAAQSWEHADLVRVSGQSNSVVSQWLGKGSKEIKSIGKMEAAERIAEASGYAALWVAKGLGPKKRSPPVGPSLHDALERVGVALAQAMPPDDRAELADIMAMWARYEGKDKYRKATEELLTEPQSDAQAEPGKRTGTW
jgi:hypothetical protein